LLENIFRQVQASIAKFDQYKVTDSSSMISLIMFEVSCYLILHFTCLTLSLPESGILFDERK